MPSAPSFHILLGTELQGTDSKSPPTALPAAPFNITVTKLSSSNASVAWMPGADGRAMLLSCTVQVS